MKKKWIYLFLGSAILFALPSIIYIIQKGTVLNFEPYFKFLLNNEVSRIDQTMLYIITLGLMTFFYWKVIKNRNDIFKTTKSMFTWITIITLIFVIVLPFLSSDIFYYLGTGRIAGRYGQNPYYTSISAFVQNGNTQLLQSDTVLTQGYLNYWSETTVVYGALWTLICQIIGFLSFGNINLGLLIFKLINAAIHILNTFIIYKTTNKKSITLIYALNPFILIEAIASGHNDIFVVLFILLAIYFVRKKQNILTCVTFLALAASIKYFSIILLPFIIIYHYRKEKTSKRLIKCIQYGLIFVLVFMIPYILYIRDIEVFKGIFTQQDKIAKGIYVIISQYFLEPQGFVDMTKNILLTSFIIIFAAYCIPLLYKKKISFKQEMEKANYFIMAFLFLLITNFQPWYIMWLFPLMIYQKADNIKLIAQIAIISQFANSIFLAYGEGWQNGVPFIYILTTASLTAYIINQKQKNNRKIKCLTKERKIG